MKLLRATMLLTLCLGLSLNAHAETRTDYIDATKSYMNKNGVSSQRLKNQQQRNMSMQNKQSTTTVTDDERTITPGKKTIKNKSKNDRKRERARQRTRVEKSQGMND